MSNFLCIDIEDFSERTSIWSASETYLPMPKEIGDALFGPGSFRYLQEVCIITCFTITIEIIRILNIVK